MAGGMAATYENSPLDALCLTTLGGSMFDYVPKKRIKIAKHLPHKAIAAGLWMFNKFTGATNKNYKEKSVAKMKEKKVPYFGATKIPNSKEFFRYIIEAPTFIQSAYKIKQPTLVLHGEKDPFLNFNKANNMLSSMGLTAKRINEDNYKQEPAKEKRAYLIEGADHSLNTKTLPDDCFNQDPKYQYVKDIIKHHFDTFLQ